MKDKVFLTYVLMDALFVISGGILLVFALTTKTETKSMAVNTVARNLLLMQCPLTESIANAIVVFVTFLVSVPAMAMPMTRGWLKLQGYMVVGCAIFTLILGLDIWFTTLKTRSNLATLWNKQPATTQSLLQLELQCCGYMNSTSPPFVVDTQCPNAIVAASQIGCVTPFSQFANNFLDLVFTGAFGIVGIDVALILAIAMLVKDRNEKERYRHIDEKNGAGAI